MFTCTILDVKGIFFLFAIIIPAWYLASYSFLRGSPGASITGKWSNLPSKPQFHGHWSSANLAGWTNLWHMFDVRGDPTTKLFTHCTQCPGGLSRIPSRILNRKLEVTTNRANSLQVMRGISILMVRWRGCGNELSRLGSTKSGIYGPRFG